MTDRRTVPAALAQGARERFVTQVRQCLREGAAPLGQRLIDLADQAASRRESQERRDAALDFDRLCPAWLEQADTVLRQALDGVSFTTSSRPPLADGLSLLDEDTVERNLLASRLSQGLVADEAASLELGDLRVRLAHLHDDPRPAETDVLQPQGLSAALVQAWLAAGLSRQAWSLGAPLLQQQLAPMVLATYQALNESLAAQGVLPDIDRSRRVRRAAEARPRPERPTGSPSAPGTGPATAPGMGGAGGAAGVSGGAGGAGGAAFGGGRGHGGGGSTGPAGPGMGGTMGASATGAGGSGGPGGAAGSGAGAAGGASLPGVFQSLRRWLQPRMASGAAGGAAGFATAGLGDPQAASGGFSSAGAGGGGIVALSPGLAAALAGPDGTAASPFITSAGYSTLQLGGAAAMGATTAAPGDAADGRADVARVATALRERATDLKRQAGTPREKALIEIVALMFQSILAEERIPPSMRVWIARLQMPVLRLALAEPDFFDSLEHPARRLIDRMGSCVLGFDAAHFEGGALEAEIRRLVQMIEQYPDSAHKAFVLACEEFEAFLARHLTEPAPARRLVTVAQQVEQKETLAVRYTIELRKMLEGVPVREQVREFLFKAWVEVMAVAAVRHGVQDARTLALRQCAADLVWAASAKPTRAERTHVIARMPALMQRLREGMGLIGLPAAQQEAQVKALNEALTDAFQSRAAPIAQARIEAIAERLATLEGFTHGDADLPLDADSVAVLLGHDAQGVEVITDGGVKPDAVTRAKARSLQPGCWFRLDHNGVVRMAQYAWRSDGGHLHLFTALDGHCILIQQGRLAAYLQAGLLEPGEQEALTVRATRNALARIDANPERLLA